MKKFISAVLSASIIAASMAVPVFADYVTPEGDKNYDTVELDYDFSGTDKGGEGNTDGKSTSDGKAMKVTSETNIAIFDEAIMQKEFYLSFDFRVDAESGFISLDKKKKDGSVDKQGPRLRYVGGSLKNVSGSNSKTKEDTYDKTDIPVSLDTWYTAELEGKMKVAGAAVDLRVYDASGNVVGSQEGISLRQFYANSSNGTPTNIRVNNVSIDNIKLIQENPDTIKITTSKDEIKAGKGNATSIDYSMERLEKTVTKYDVTWSVYDENDVNEVTDVKVEDGSVYAELSSPTQTVTVRATAEFGGKELVGTKQIHIVSADITGAKFDEIIPSGDAAVSAGTSSEKFTYTAKLDGSDVTGEINEAEDIEWAVYNVDNLKPIGNKGITISGGVLTVAEDVLPQIVYVRAISKTHPDISGSAAVNITKSENQLEEIIKVFPCEEGGIITVDRDTVSIDGSTAYHTNSVTNFELGADYAEYVQTELDIRFGTDGEGNLDGGFRFKRSDGGENSSFVIHDGSLCQQTGDTKFPVLYANVDGDTWYHMQILYSPSGTASINIYAYNSDGTLNTTPVFTNTALNKRNAKSLGKIEVQGNTYIDNIKITKPLPDSIVVTAPKQYMFPGDAVQCSVTATRSGLPLDTVTGLKWEVRDEGGPIIGVDGKDPVITVSEEGYVSVDSLANAQTFKVRASAGDVYGEKEIEVQSTDIVEVTNIGRNQEGTKIVKLYVDKKFYYNDDVVFVIAIYDKEDKLAAVRTLKTYGDRLNLGENELTVDMNMPEGFDDTYSIYAMAWTTI